MRKRALLAVVAVALGVMASCGDSADVTELAMVGTGTTYTGIPTTLGAGLYEVTFRNDGPDGDGPLFISRGTASVEQFLADLAPVLEGGPTPAYFTTVVGLPTTPAGQSTTSTFTLPSGEYYLVSFFESDRQPVVLPVSVAGEDPDVADLSGGAVITARDYSFSVEGVAPGRQTVTFRNDGPGEFHHAVLMRFADGSTEAEAQATIEALFSLDEGEEPPAGVVPPEDLADTGVFSSGTGGTIDVTFEEGGTYGVFCFISDRQGGPPHAIAYQMMEIFEV